MKLTQDLREFIGLLTSENVRYLVIGGWAYNRYAEPRFTGDIDFFIEDTDENLARLRRVLERFGFGDVLPPPNQNLFAKKVIMLGRPPNRIDLLREISGVSFESCWRSAETGTLDALNVYFISKKDLVLNKQSAGRDKDLLDVKTLLEFSK